MSDNPIERRNGMMVDDANHVLTVQMFIETDEAGSPIPNSLAQSLGTLEISKDFVKEVLSKWNLKALRKSGIIVPRIISPNGNGASHG